MLVLLGCAHVEDHVRFRRPDHRRQPARRPGPGPAGRTADRRLPAIAGACAGLAGYFEVAAIQGRANSSLAAGYGFTGILVSFLARHNPIAIMPVAILFGGLAAAGGIIQRRMGLPDATVLVLQGFIFVVLLASRRCTGGFAVFRPRRGART